jgi:ureidoacrylate peracid hydrolase
MTAATLVIDMQNGFLHPDGSSARHGQPLPTAPEVIAATADLLAAARAAGLPVIHVRHVYRPDLVDMPARLARLWPTDPEPVVRGTWDAEIVDELTPLPGDEVIEKNRYDAFLYTDLDVLLRARGVDRLLVAGVLTNVCVETTVRSADQRGFDCYVAADCTAAYGETHVTALAAMSVLFATVAPGKELVSQL